MTGLTHLKFAFLGATALAAVFTPAFAADFDIPGGDLKSALDTYAHQTGVALVYREDSIKGVRTKGVRGALSSDDALANILSGTGFRTQHQGGAVIVVRGSERSDAVEIAPIQLAQAASTPHAAVETVTVTSSKLGGADVQSIPIAITALEPGTADGDPDRRRAGSDQTGSEYDLHEDQFRRLQHPNSRHRHAGDFGDDRSGGGGGVQRYSVHPQPFLRAGILRRGQRGSGCAARRARSMAATRRRASSI